MTDTLEDSLVLYHKTIRFLTITAVLLLGTFPKVKIYHMDVYSSLFIIFKN